MDNGYNQLVPVCPILEPISKTAECLLVLPPILFGFTERFGTILTIWRSAVAEWLRRRGASLGVPGSIPSAGNSYALQALEQGC